MRLRALAALIVAILFAIISPLAVGAKAGGRPHPPATGELRLVRLIEAGDIGLLSPRGLAYAPESANLVISGTAADRSMVLRSITLLEKPVAQTPLPAGLPASPNIAYDAATDQLVAATSTALLINVPAAGGKLVAAPRASTAAVVGGSTADPATGVATTAGGDTLLLSARGTVAVVAGANGSDRVSRTLSLSAGEELRGLTVAPNGHLFSIGPATRTLYEFDAAGTLLVRRDLNQLNVRSPQGLVVAPTADTDDDPSLTSLYLADAGAADGSGAGILEVAFSEPVVSPVVLAAQPSITLVRTVNTGVGSVLNPDSPDPSGLAYIPASETDVPTARRHRLVIADGEVEETTGAGWHNVNVWFAPTDGSAQTATLDTTQASPTNKEPVGAAYDPARNELYIAKDGGNGRIWVYNAVTMAQVRTFDVTVAPYNDADDEGLAFANGILYMVDAIDNDLVKVLPGGDGVVGTGGDDVVANYDLEQYGQTEPEGIDVHPVTGNIWVVSNRLHNGVPDPMIEVTPTGQLVSTVSIAAANPNSAAGLAIAPPSGGGSGWNIYISDRGVDNGNNPGENDGKIYEFAVGGTASAPDTTITGGPSGTVTSPDATFTFSGTTGTTGFECQLDNGGFSACSSPTSYAGLGDGSHTFDVRALAGSTPDPTPASRTWAIDTQVASGNLLSNPGFELDLNGNGIPDDWGSKTKFTRSAAIAPHGGTYVGRQFATNNSGWTVFQLVDVSAGASYAFDGYVNVPATSDSFTFQIKLKWMNGTQKLKTTSLAPITGPTAGWQLMSGSAVAPSGATSVQVAMTVKSLNATVYVDDFSFAAGP